MFLFHFRKEDFLSVRTLLELNEQLLHKYGLGDIWKREKQTENSAALRILHKRLKEIDRIESERKKWEELFRGVLAGNIFDSGANSVQVLLSENQNFGLEDALEKIQDRPWLIDSFDDFIKRLETVLKFIIFDGFRNVICSLNTGTKTQLFCILLRQFGS